jgi:hypothetical protein
MKQNGGSIRVLVKNGFTVIAEENYPSSEHGEDTNGPLIQLSGSQKSLWFHQRRSKY